MVSKGDTPKEYELRPRMTFSGGFWPAILAVGSNPELPLEPLEYSADAGVHTAIQELQHKPEFLLEVRDALMENDLVSTFGLGVPRTTATGFELVEFTEEDRTSVSKELPSAQVNEMKVIETGWLFGKGAAGTCTKSCFAKCNVPGHSPTHSPVHAPGIVAG